MITAAYVPKVGMAEDDISVTEWLRSNGDEVKQGEPIVVIETAKASSEVEAPASGFLFHLRQPADMLKVGDVLGVIVDSPEEFEEFKVDNEGTRGARTGTPTAEEDDAAGAGRTRASLTGKPGAQSTGAPPPQRAAEDRREPLAGMRLAIARNMLASLQTAAQMTVFAEADLTELDRFRKELLLDNSAQKITYVDLFCKLTATVLKEFPVVNSSLIDNEIVYWGHCNVGFAVALEHGLVVPVVKDADRKSLSVISREISKLSRKARENRLDVGDCEGGTFTLTSGGRNEVEFMTPIINPPQCAILGLGKIGPKPAIHRGELAIRTMTHLCLTHDHRVVDGVMAGEFVGRLKELAQSREQFERILR